MYDIDWKWLDEEEFKELVKDLYWFEVELYEWRYTTNQGDSVTMFSIKGVDYKTIHYDYELIGVPFKDYRDMTPDELSAMETRLIQFVDNNNDYC